LTLQQPEKVYNVFARVLMKKLALGIFILIACTQHAQELFFQAGYQFSDWICKILPQTSTIFRNASPSNVQIYQQNVPQKVLPLKMSR